MVNRCFRLKTNILDYEKEHLVKLRLKAIILNFTKKKKRVPKFFPLLGTKGKIVFEVKLEKFVRTKTHLAPRLNE